MEPFLLSLRVLGLADASILTLLKRFSAPQDSEPSSLHAWLAEAGARHRWLRVPELDEVQRAAETAAALLAQLCSQGLRVHGLLSADYPVQLKGLKESPVLFYSQGDIKLLEQTGIAIVGTRHPSDQGLAICDWSAEQVHACGLVILSSLERGIDSRAHLRSLALGGSTLGVLGCAHDQLASGQRNLAEAVLAAGGCLVSGQMPGSKPSPSRMDDMHRLIGGLCRAMMLIESYGPGGSETSFRFARSYGRALAYAGQEQETTDEVLLLNRSARLIASGGAVGLPSAQAAARWLRTLDGVDQNT